jgi:hypothetical protein
MYKRKQLPQKKKKNTKGTASVVKMEVGSITTV